jgi:hypothetical protein
MKIYGLTAKMQENFIGQFSDFDTLNLLNLFLNLATSAEYFYIIERGLLSSSSLMFAARKNPRTSDYNSSYVMTLSSEKNKSLTEIAVIPSSPSIVRMNKDFRRSLGASSVFFCSDRNFDIGTVLRTYENEYSSLSCYIRIQNPIFIDILFRYLFEVQTSYSIKEFYLLLIRDMVKNSKYNAVFLGKVYFCLLMINLLKYCTSALRWPSGLIILIYKQVKLNRMYI